MNLASEKDQNASKAKGVKICHFMSIVLMFLKHTVDILKVLNKKHVGHGGEFVRTIPGASTLAPRVRSLNIRSEIKSING